MSGLLRVHQSASLASRRFLLSPTSASLLRRQPTPLVVLFSARTDEHRPYSWAPPAYRKPRKRRKKDKKISGLEALWEHLQQVYGDTTSEEKEKCKKKDPARAFSRRKDRLYKTQREFKDVLARYQSALFPSEPPPSPKSKKSVLVLLENLHEKCSNDDAYNSETITRETILETEATFRDLGTLVRQLISLFSRLPAEETSFAETPSVMAEQLLHALVQLKSDRASLITRMEQAHLEHEKQQQQSWMAWFQQVFVFSPGTQEDDSTTTQLPFVHQTKSFGPTKRQFVDVMNGLIHEAKQYKWDPDAGRNERVRKQSKEKRDAILAVAKRMSSLLNVTDTIAPILRLTQPVMETYAAVGSMEAAQQAQYVYTNVCHKRVPRQVFHTVLQAFRVAAMMEPSPEMRAKAAMRALELLKDREAYSSPQAYHPPGNNDLRQEAYCIVLDTMWQAGVIALPDMMEQAEGLIKSFVGEAAFDSVVNYNGKTMLPKVDLQVFEHLLVIYTFSRVGDPEKFQKAKNILLCAEDKRAGSQQDVSFPNVRTYNAVLFGTEKRIRSIKRQMERSAQGDDESSEADKLRDMIQAQVSYAMSSLDRMAAHNSSFPNQKTFLSLLRICRTSELPESGERADELLSRNSIYQACEPSWQWSRNHLLLAALQCWEKSAKAPVPGILPHVLRILDSMEAQSGLSLTPITTLESYSQVEKNIYEEVYEWGVPGTHQVVYNQAIKVCSFCEDEPEAAMEAAFGIYNRMIAAGVRPIGITYRNLLACCEKLLRDDAKRQKELTETVVLFASEQAGLSRSDLFNRKKRMGRKK